ncbi:hypothetical protein C8R43DRAFT_43586 [Mycena crocata]|nr:hypothetical protein C8R43DRAFT_43586 [Mycena crocata]
MPLHSLDADVLLSILALLDVSTILSVSRVNRALHAITSSKHLWLSVVRDLCGCGRIDGPPDETLQMFSTDELIDEIKRAVLGPRTWSPSSQDPPTVLRQMVLPFNDNMPKFVELLPGGRYLIMYTRDHVETGQGIECWDVYTTRRVWRWQRPGHWVGHFAFQFRLGLPAIVLLTFRNDDDHDHILILEIDLANWESREMFHSYPATMRLWDFSWQIDGDLVACRVQPVLGVGPMTRDVLLLNWRTQEFILFRGPTKYPTFALFPGHLMLGYFPDVMSSSLSGQIRLHAISSLDGLWRSAGNLNYDELTDAMSIPTILIDFPPDHEWEGIFVCRCPLQEDTYDLSLDVLNFTPHPQWRRPAPLLTRIRNRLMRRDRLTYPVKDVVCRYHLLLPRESTSPPPPLTRTCTLYSPAMEMSAAGYSITTDRRTANATRVILFHPANKTQVGRPLVLPIPDSDDLIAVNLGYSGALVATYNSRVVVSYYV